MADLTGDVELDVRDALEQISELGDSLDSGLERGGREGVADVEDALSGISADIPIEFDVDDAIAVLEASIEQIQTDLPVDLDPSMAEEAIAVLQGTIDNLESTVEVDADVSAAEATVDALTKSLEDQQIDIGVNFDDGGAQDEVESLGDSLSGMEAKAEESGGGLDSAGSSATILSAAMQAAQGKTHGLLGAFDALGGKALGVTAAVAGITAGYAALFEAGEKAEAANERLDIVFGDMAESVQKINVGGLNGELGELAIKAGSSGGQLKQAVANMGQMAIASGQSKEQAAAFSKQVAALSLEITAMNPNLGEAGQVADRLSIALARGGPRLARYGIDVNAAAISQRALADTGKQTAAQLTVVERATAGAALATEQLGDKLGENFAKGAEQSTVRLKSLEQQLRATFAEAGKKLVEPTIDALEDLAPAAEEIAHLLGDLAESTLPLVASAFGVIGPVVRIVAQALDAIPGPLLAFIAAAVTLNKLSGPLESGLGFVANQFLKLAVAADGANLARTSSSLLAVGSAAETAGVGIGGFAGSLGLLVGLAAVPITILAIAGAFDDVESQEDLTAAATERLRQEFEDQRGTLEGLRSSLKTASVDYEDYIKKQSRFAKSNQSQIDDIHNMGISVQKLGELLQQGSAGLERFIRLAVNTGEVGLDFGDAPATVKQLTDLFEHGSLTLTKYQVGAIGASGATDAFKQAAADGVITLKDLDLGIGDLEEKNLDLIKSFLAESKALDKVNKETLHHLEATGELEPVIGRAAVAFARAEGSANVYGRALELAANASEEILPNLDDLTLGLLKQQRTFTDFSSAVDAAVTGLPSLGSALQSAAQDVTDLQRAAFEASDATGEFVESFDPQAIVGSLDSATSGMQAFFFRTQDLFQTGRTNLATALLQLGPEVGGPLAEQLFAAGDGAIAAFEESLTRLADTRVQIEIALGEISARAKIITESIGTDMGTTLANAFGQSDVRQLATIPLEQLRAMQTSIQQATPGVEQAFRDMGFNETQAHKAALQFLSTDTEAILKIAAGEWDADTTSVEAAKNYAERTTAGAAAKLKDLPEGVKEVLRENGVILKDDVAGAQGGEEAGRKTKEGHKRGLEGMDKNAIAEAGKAGTAAAAEGARHTGQMAESGRALGHGLATGIGDSTEKVKGAGRGLATDGASGARNTGAWSDAGGAAGGAYANAIDSGANVAAAQAAGRHLAQEAAKAARNAGSPTEHLWFDAATDAAEAYGLGFMDSARSVAASARDFASIVAGSAGSAGVNTGLIAGRAGAGHGAVTNVNVRSGAVQLTLNPPAGATPAEVGEMAREATSASLAELQSELAALGS